MKNVLQKMVNPFYQAGGVIALYLIVILISTIFDSEKRMPWTLAVAFQLLFILYTVIIGLLFKSKLTYWSYSIIGYMIIMVINSFIASKISGISMDEAGTYKWIYFILIPIFLLFIVMANLIRKIVSMAEQEDRRFDKSN